MDQDLIRKAAEAMLEQTYVAAGIDERFRKPLDKEDLDVQQDYLRSAEAALTVFYEHTRGQTREGHGAFCADCFSPMIPIAASLGHWTCPTCGKTV